MTNRFKAYKIANFFKSLPLTIFMHTPCVKYYGLMVFYLFLNLETLTGFNNKLSLYCISSKMMAYSDYMFNEKTENEVIILCTLFVHW